ncbi:hypothetical protein [Labrenzia sp. OB1]|uniref:hypothetical protein n=1 Tax=Labrenzia sp. OB1 TaxID=1561204 RepID=UPI0007B2043D|nr:hypothetical protein [Labrenzia sp. OB1]KZM47385.1 hypothetical protein OA90_26335 [Labrenzia sp. OB1]
MGEWKPLTTIEDSSGERRVVICCKDALYRHHAEMWMLAADEDEGCYGDGFWMETSVSGYFSTIEDCQREARLTVDWLRSQPEWET